MALTVKSGYSPSFTLERLGIPLENDGRIRGEFRMPTKSKHEVATCVMSRDVAGGLRGRVVAVEGSKGVVNVVSELPGS